MTLRRSPDITAPIQCGMAYCKLGSVRYEALSYEWGLPSKCDPERNIDEQRFSVRRNLRDALLYIREKNHDRILWIDALSINQQSEKKKSQQVRAMGRIYSCADQVVVWLGLATDSSERVMDMINKLYHKSLDFNQLSSDVLRAILDKGRTGSILPNYTVSLKCRET